MFRQIAGMVVDPANPTPTGPGPAAVDNQVDYLFRLHPADLVSLIETAWRDGFRPGIPPLRSPVPDIGAPVGSGVLANWPTTPPSGRQPTLPGSQLVFLPLPLPVPFGWDHLIYAYLIENTRVYEIFRRVIHGLLHGEQLGIPELSETFEWLRTTEELFYKSGAPLTVLSVDSHLRPDMRATRRNAYHRMLGMDLNHGTDENPTHPYEKSVTANRDFVVVFEEFLRQVWIGIAYSPSTGAVNGPLPIDAAGIANLAQRLQIMLNERRGGQAERPNLAREEFVAVATMAWFDLTLLVDSPIVRDLKAVAASPEERLRRIGERVGLPPHSRSHSYFILAPLVSQLLIEIEGGQYSNATAARALFLPQIPTVPPTANPIRARLETIIHHWSLATGRDLKSAAVSATQRFAAAAPQPMAAGTPSPGPAMTNLGAAPAVPVSPDGSGTPSPQTLGV